MKNAKQTVKSFLRRLACWMMGIITIGIGEDIFSHNPLFSLDILVGIVIFLVGVAFLAYSMSDAKSIGDMAIFGLIFIILYLLISWLAPGILTSLALTSGISGIVFDILVLGLSMFILLIESRKEVAASELADA